ncbi:hypothetical protein ACFQZZ_18490 [Nocardia sp. GCM10030253]|uniref:hypothetical protein n=1 Tax=Nocardia sp. GCM10030253 TaxID=3273404 RepID=UPI0036364D9C
MTIEITKAADPTFEWLAAQVGAGALWRPADLPERLEHAESRAFLTEVGFPAVAVDGEWFDSADLPEKGMWEADPDELFGRRYPDDDSPPAKYAYGLGEFYGEMTLMLDGETGVVQVYAPSGWDHGEGDQGVAFASVREAAGAVALMAGLAARLEGPDSDEAARELISAIRAHEWAESTYWVWVLERLEEDYLEQ